MIWGWSRYWAGRGEEPLWKTGSRAAHSLELMAAVFCLFFACPATGNKLNPKRPPV